MLFILQNWAYCKNKKNEQFDAIPYYCIIKHVCNTFVEGLPLDDTCDSVISCSDNKSIVLILYL